MAHVDWVEGADAATIAEAIAARLRATASRIAVPGGKTPIPILERLAIMSFDWSRTTISLTDDREVPADDPASNFGLLQRTMGATGAKLEALTPGPVAPWDLLWVGMGEDGHVASIFPHPGLDEALPAEVVRLVPDPLPPEAPYPRLTQTYSGLAATADMMIVIAGAAKRRVLEGALAGADLPVGRLLRRTRAPVTIYWSA